MSTLYVSRKAYVHAYRINGVSLQDDGSAVIALEGMPNFQVSPAMLARFVEDGKELVNGDYLVVQADGYTYLNPKEVFERKYQQPRTENLRFGDAVEAIKSGKRVARAGWNGKGMWVCYGQGHPQLPAHAFWNPHTKAFAEANGGNAPVRDYLIMKTAQNEIMMGWTPTGSDVLAHDWVVLADE